MPELVSQVQNLPGKPVRTPWGWLQVSFTTPKWCFHWAHPSLFSGPYSEWLWSVCSHYIHFGCFNEFICLEKRALRPSGCHLHGSVWRGWVGGVSPTPLPQPPSDEHASFKVSSGAGPGGNIWNQEVQFVCVFIPRKTCQGAPGWLS